MRDDSHLYCRSRYLQRSRLLPKITPKVSSLGLARPFSRRYCMQLRKPLISYICYSLFLLCPVYVVNFDSDIRSI